MNIRSLLSQRALESAVFLFVIFAMLWRGGKTLESTWLLALLAMGVTLAQYWLQRKKTVVASDVPMATWIVGLAYVGWTVVSFLTSSTQNYGLDEVLRDASLLLLFFWVVRIKSSTQDPLSFSEKFAMTLTIGIIVACVLGVAVYALQPVNRFVGSFFNERFHVDYWPNAWAQLVLLCWPLSVVVTRQMRWPLRAMIVGFIIGCLFLSYSRGGILAFSGQAALWVLVLALPWLRGGPSLQSVLRKVRVMVAAGLIAIVAFFVSNAVRSSFHEVESVTAKVTFTADEGKSSMSERKQFWMQSFRLSLERPLVGWGPYSFRFIQPRLQTGVFETSDHAHNMFLKTAMERGWPAAILFIAFLSLCLVPAAWAQLRRMTQEKEMPDRFTIAALIAILGVIAHNMIDYNLQFVGIVLPFWMLLGCLVIPKPTRIPTRVVRTTEIALAVLLGIVTVLEGRYLVVSSLGRHAEAAGNVDDALVWYERSRGEVFSRDLHLSRAALLLGDHRPEEATTALDEYLAQNMEDARAWKLLGDARVAAEDDDAALAAYGRAWELGKYNYISILHSMVGLLHRTRNEEIIAMERPEIEEVFQAFGEAILQNSHFIALSQNVEEFAAAGALLQRLYPQDAPSFAAYTQDVVRHAAEERIRLRSKRQGLLW